MPGSEPVQASLRATETSWRQLREQAHARLADPATPARLFAETQARGLFISTLVNNAGYGVPGRYLSADWKTHADSLQVLLTSVAHLTHLYLPAMEAAGRGRILNVASLAGLVPPTGGHTLYGPAKAFVIRFSETLAKELGPRGVHVTALCPGMTYTEFHDVNGMREKVSQLPKGIWLTSAEVAKLAVDAVARPFDAQSFGKVAECACRRSLINSICPFRRTDKQHNSTQPAIPALFRVIISLQKALIQPCVERLPPVGMALFVCRHIRRCRGEVNKNVRRPCWRQCCAGSVESGLYCRMHASQMDSLA